MPREQGNEVNRRRVMYCPCGNARVLALGLCATCYTLRRQDEEHFGGLRDAVLERDGYRCRVCDASGRDKRSIVVHHRVPGKSVLKLMVFYVQPVMRRFTGPRLFFPPCSLFSWSYGVSSIRKGTSRSSLTSGTGSRPQNLSRCSQTRRNPLASDDSGVQRDLEVLAR